MNFLLHESESEVDLTFPHDKFKQVDYGASLSAEFLCSSRWGIVVSNYFGLLYNGEYEIRGVDIEDQGKFNMNRNNIFHIGVQYYLQ